MFTAYRSCSVLQLVPTGYALVEHFAAYRLTIESNFLSLHGTTLYFFLRQIWPEVEILMEVTGHECTVEIEQLEILSSSN
jgi:hypothetical protein